jgi:hypothetical protein
MKCPNCNHEWKDEGRKKGGEKSKRTISPEAQAKMQAGRKKPKADIEQKGG